LRNETSTTGDVYLEGSVHQIKNLLKHFLIVKPACMFDNNIKVDFHVSFASNGKYSD
jgi:hypothetical protein